MAATVVAVACGRDSGVVVHRFTILRCRRRSEPTRRRCLGQARAGPSRSVMSRRCSGAHDDCGYVEPVWCPSAPMLRSLASCRSSRTRRVRRYVLGRVRAVVSLLRDVPTRSPLDVTSFDTAPRCIRRRCRGPVHTPCSELVGPVGSTTGPGTLVGRRRMTGRKSTRNAVSSTTVELARALSASVLLVHRAAGLCRRPVCTSA